MSKEEDPLEGDLEGSPPLAGVDLPDGADGAGDPGVVDQQIDGTKLSLRLMHRFGHGLGIGNIAGQGDRRPAGAGDGGNGLGELVLGTSGDRHGRTGGGEGLRDEAADAPSSARYDGDLAREVTLAPDRGHLQRLDVVGIKGIHELLCELPRLIHRGLLHRRRRAGRAGRASPGPFRSRPYLLRDRQRRRDTSGRYRWRKSTDSVARRPATHRGGSI